MSTASLRAALRGRGLTVPQLLSVQITFPFHCCFGSRLLSQ